MTTPTATIIPLLTEQDRAAKLAVLVMAEDQILGAVKIRMRLRQELGMAEGRLTTAEVMRLLTGGSEMTPSIQDSVLAELPATVLPTPEGTQPCGCDPSHRIDGVIKGYINPDCPTHAVPRDAPTLPPLLDIPFGTPPTRTRTREGDQPLPAQNDHPRIVGRVHGDIDARSQLGYRRYGTHLQPYNGRDALRDAYEDAIDLVLYLRQVIYERDGK